MTLPTPYALTVREPTAGARDEFGNPTTTWTERTWRVHAVAPGAMAEPGEANRDLSLVLYTVLGPKAGAPTSPHAQIRVDGAWLDVDGTPDDWTRGPWPHPTAGVSVMLRRADG